MTPASFTGVIDRRGPARGGYAFVKTPGRLFKNTRWHLQKLSSKVAKTEAPSESAIRVVLIESSSTVIAFNKSVQLLVLSRNGKITLSSAITGKALMDIECISASTPLGPGDFLFSDKVIVFKRCGSNDRGVYVFELLCHSLLHGNAQCHRILPTDDVSLHWLDSSDDAFIAIPHNTQIGIPFNIKDSIGRKMAWVMGHPIIWANSGQNDWFLKRWVAAINEMTISRDLIGALMDEESAYNIDLGSFVSTATTLFTIDPGSSSIAKIYERILYVFSTCSRNRKFTRFQAFDVAAGYISAVFDTTIPQALELESIQISPAQSDSNQSAQSIITAQKTGDTAGIIALYTHNGAQSALSSLVEVPLAPQMLVRAERNFILSELFSIFIF